MINPKEDRINYKEILIPQDGYELDRAVGTTYSLDLNALIAIAFPLGLNSIVEENKVAPLNIYTALKEIYNKIVLFCDAGQIKLPKNKYKMYQLLDRTIVPVKMKNKKNRKGKIPSFHPKVWILKYVKKTDKKDEKYKLVIMSRNLTFDHSWDVACVIDGNKTKSKCKQSEPIKDFLNFLEKKIDVSSKSNNNKIVSDIKKDIEKVKFEIPDGFKSLKIFPLGIGESLPSKKRDKYDIKKEELYEKEFDKLLIMSPFISKDFIKNFNEKKKNSKDNKRILITRESELKKIDRNSASQFSIYTLKDYVIDSENSISSDADIKQDENNYMQLEPMDESDYKKQDIHAKMYIREKDKNTELWLGSMNASHSAIHDNVEMMIKLETENKTMKDFLNDIMCDDVKDEKQQNPFKKIENIEDYKDEKGKDDNNIDNLIKKICHVEMEATLKKKKKNKYSIIINIKGVMPEEINNYDVTIYPWYKGKEKRRIQKGIKEIEFKNLEEDEISELYILELKGEKKMIQIPTVGIPEDRDEKIVNDIIKSIDDFWNYMNFFISDDYIKADRENSINSRVAKNGVNKSIYSSQDKYEGLLKMSLFNFDSLKKMNSEIDVILKNEKFKEDKEKLKKIKEFKEIINVIYKTV